MKISPGDSGRLRCVTVQRIPAEISTIWTTAGENPTPSAIKPYRFTEESIGRKILALDRPIVSPAQGLSLPAGTVRTTSLRPTSPPMSSCPAAASTASSSSGVAGVDVVAAQPDEAAGDFLPDPGEAGGTRWITNIEREALQC
jgi:hypothetical protein